MIESYNDLYESVSSAVDSFMKKNESAELVFGKSENGTCFVTNKQNGNKLVFMFARYADEYKVGFAFYVPDELGGMGNPEWIEDTFSHEFDQKFIHILIEDHLLQTFEQDW